MGIYEIFKLIYSFEEETKVELQETFSNVKGEVLLSKSFAGLIFNLEHPHYRLFFKKESKFIISYNLLKIKILHFSINLGKINLLSRICNAYMFQSLGFNEKNKKYFCYYSNIDKNHFKLLFHTDKDEFNILIDNINFKISTCYIIPQIKHSFLCIESDSKIDFKSFKHYVNNIIVSLGFVSGRFYKTEEFYFQSKHKDFSKETEFYYRSSNLKYSFPVPITNQPSYWNWKFDERFVLSEELINKWSSNINENNITSLVNLSIKKPRIYFSIRMLFDFYNTPQISRVSLLFVVLETLCEELNSKKVFVEKEFKKEIGLLALQRIKKKIDNEDLIILQDIIENIDSKLTNNVVYFEQTIKSLKLNFTNEERKILANRNEFFHGRIIPTSHNINSEEDYSSLEHKYDYYSLRLFVLVSKILLKKSGFEGYLINYSKLFEDDNEMNLKESYFIKL